MKTCITLFPTGPRDKWVIVVQCIFKDSVVYHVRTATQETIACETKIRHKTTQIILEGV